MKVAVLCGGRSFERAVSLRSGARVCEALREMGHEAVTVDVDAQASRTLKDGDFDCAFVALHGAGGEDGTVQDLLELIGLPYTGARPGPSRMAYDKASTKRILLTAGVATPPFLSLSAAALQEFGAADVLTEVRDSLHFPIVAKPVSGGSALGICFVSDAAELPRSLVAAMSYDSHVILERYVAGREVSASIVGTDDPRCLPLVRIDPRHADYYDFESRYTHGETEFTCPPSDLSDEIVATCESTALASYQALDLSGFARVDMIVDEAGVPQVLELNSIPGLTDTSLLPLAWDATGEPFSALIELLVTDAIEQHSDGEPS